MFMCSFVVCYVDDLRILLLMVLGWVWIDMGGFEVCLSIVQSVLNFVDIMDVWVGKLGLQYFDYFGWWVFW